MTIMSRALVFAVIAAIATPALAGSRHSNRYEMTRVPIGSDNSEIAAAPPYYANHRDNIVILDKRSGVLWTLDNSGLVMYLGQIFPFEDSRGSIARIIHVEPRDR